MKIEEEGEEDENNDKEQNYHGCFTSLSYIDKARNPDITKLDLSRDTDLKNLFFLRFFPNLKELDLSNSFNIRDNYQFVKHLEQLEKLNLFSIGLTTAVYLTPLKNLKQLSISCPIIGEAVEYLTQLPVLKDLEICGCTKGIWKISRLTSLKRLGLRGIFSDVCDSCNESMNEEFPQLEFLASLTNLRELDISCNEYINFIQPIVNLPKLKRLSLSGDLGIQDLYHLKELNSLEILDLRYLNSIFIRTFEEDIKVLAEHPNLQELWIDNYVALPELPDRVKIMRR